MIRLDLTVSHTIHLQKEYNLLREEIQRLIVENRQLSTAERALGKAVDTDVNPEPELDRNEPIDTNFIQYKRCTDNAIQNLHDQIASLNEVSIPVWENFQSHFSDSIVF